MMSDRQFTSQIIGRRIAEKRRAPLAAAARKALKKAADKLVKLYGGDTLMISYVTSRNENSTLSRSLEALQRGESVTLRMIHWTREPTDILDSGESHVAGEIVVKL